MTTLAISGLAIIMLSWLIQLLHAWKKGGRMADTFLLTYGIGTALLLVDGGQRALTTDTWLYFLVLLIVALVYIRIHRS